jgi:hypothetical protein
MQTRTARRALALALLLAVHCCGAHAQTSHNTGRWPQFSELISAIIGEVFRGTNSAWTVDEKLTTDWAQK